MKGEPRAGVFAGGVSRAMLVIVVLLAAPTTSARADVEEFNQWTFELNRTIQDAIVRPGVEGYRQGVPETVQTRISRIYGNLTEPVTATAHVLDANFRAAGESSVRFVVNSTLGILGAIDFADNVGLPKTDNTFSGAVCRSGFPLGAFLVLPVIGPTTAGIALAAGTLMVGSTYALLFVSTELAVASVAIDVIGTAAALENTVTGSDSDAVTYSLQRSRFIETLDTLCGQAGRAP